MNLGQLIEWLETQNPDTRVENGFGSPHSDRGDYSDLAFEPEQTTTIECMLSHAKSALGETFTGWKGGDYEMNSYTDVYIGEYGSCGEEITTATLRYWELQESYQQLQESKN